MSQSLIINLFDANVAFLLSSRIEHCQMNWYVELIIPQVFYQVWFLIKPNEFLIRVG